MKNKYVSGIDLKRKKKEADAKRKRRALLAALIFLVFLSLLGWIALSVIDLRKSHRRLLAANEAFQKEIDLRCQGETKAAKLLTAKKVDLKNTPGGGWALYVKGVPFLIKGIGYNPTPIGEGYTYDFSTDKAKPWLIDGKLMQEAGINCVRIYSVGKDLEKTREFIRDMYEKYGIYTIVSDWLGLWDYPRANYSDRDFQERTKQRVLEIVKALKDEEGLLMWILGNENNYTFSGRIGFWTSAQIEKLKEPGDKINKRAEIYYTFVNELAGEIKKIDKVHSIALGNGEANYLKIASEICDNIDILAVIIYRGKKFGNLFNTVRQSFDKPILVSEFGCDSYNAYKEEEDQEVQSEFILSQWKDLYASTLCVKQDGNVIGGCLFEWNDEWWKHNEGYSPDWKVHNTQAGWSHGAYYFDIRVKDNLNMNEEWFGIVSLSKKLADGINKRVPKKAYYSLKDFLTDLPCRLR